MMMSACADEITPMKDNLRRLGKNLSRGRVTRLGPYGTCGEVGFLVFPMVFVVTMLRSGYFLHINISHLEHIVSLLNERGPQAHIIAGLFMMEAVLASIFINRLYWPQFL